MSWVAIAVMGPIGAAGAAMAALPRKRTVHFHPCQYCKRPPDAGQTSAQCISCGAYLFSSSTTPPESKPESEPEVTIMTPDQRRRKEEENRRRKQAGYRSPSSDSPSSNPMDPARP